MDDEQAARRLSALTLEEKAALCTGETAWTTAPVERIGLPSIRVADGPHGVRRTPDSSTMAFGAHDATCFPTAACLAATWNVDLAREVGAAIAREAIALGVDVVLGPGVNMKRSPLCGRNFEYFSEDPVVAGGARGRLDRRGSVARGRDVAQALRREQPGDAADVRQRRGRRASPPRDLPAGLRDGRSPVASRGP